MNTLNLFAALFLALPAADDGWIDLSSTPKAREGWRELKGDWVYSDDAKLNPKDERQLTGDPKEGGPVLVVCKLGKTKDLFTVKKYADLEARVEFMLGKKSNAGVKMLGLYEIQLYDSFGKDKLTGSDCGGIYPRGEDRPIYHTIDDGVPPKLNACKPAGQWQTIEISFVAPKFVDGKKTTNAKFVKVVLNGQVIHENVECLYPTGSNWRLAKEVPEGPFMLQCDHGPVAYRNARVRPLGVK